MLDFARINLPAPKPPAQTTDSNPPAQDSAPEPDLPAGDGPSPSAPAAKLKKRRKRARQRPFAVTPAMRRYAEVLCAPDCPATEAERCQRAGIGIRRLHAWRRLFERDGFEHWLQNEIRLILSRRMVHVWNEIYKFVKEGNFQAAKFLANHCPTSSPTPWKD